MSAASSQHELVLSGLDGANPLGYLAALGTLRTAVRAFAPQPVRMRWEQHGAWSPLLTSPATSPDALAEVLHQWLTRVVSCQMCSRDHAHSAGLCVADDLAMPAGQFRQVGLSFRGENREAAAFLAAFGSDAVTTTNSKKESVTQDTAFRTMSGAGHQHFLKFARNICAACTQVHIQRDLFELWRYEDPVQNHTLRLDPLDDARYALRWADPSGDPTRRQRGSVYGANRLAIEAFPLFNCVPQGGHLSTVAFVRDGRETLFRWPIWTPPLSLDAVRSLLTLRDPPLDKADATKLTARGVVAHFESRRMTVGKFRCFSPSRPV